MDFEKSSDLMTSSHHNSPSSIDLFIVCGEQSGDFLAYDFLQQLLSLHPSLKVGGVFGPQVSSLGLTSFLPFERFGQMGFMKVALSFFTICQNFYAIRKEIERSRPKVVLFVDFQSFNLKMAKQLRKRGYKGTLAQLVAPTVWAWKANRAAEMAKTHDLLGVLFPFEPPFFQNHGLKTFYIGHPLAKKSPPASIDGLESCDTQHPLKQKTSPSSIDGLERSDSEHLSDKNSSPASIDGLESCDTQRPLEQKSPSLSIKRELISIFPGSRPHVILSNLPCQLKAALKFHYPIAISIANETLTPLIQKIVDECEASHRVLFYRHENKKELLSRSLIALSTLGTITLELGLARIPTIATYKISSFEYHLSRYLFQIYLPHYCIVNLLLQKRIFPELIGPHATEKNIFNALSSLLNKKENTQQLEALPALLSSPLGEKAFLDQILQAILNPFRYTGPR